MKIHVGIDIGKSGAIATTTGIKLKMPLIKKELDVHELNRIFETFKPDETHVIFEKLGVIYGSSKVTAFSMGEQSGIVEALCISHNIPYTKIRAVDWQKEMFTGITVINKLNKPNKKDTKAMALIAAKRLFPTETFMLGKETTPNDGLIDAMLMAEYAKRKNL